MKIWTIILMLATTLATAGNDEGKSERVKLLPGREKGIFNLLYTDTDTKYVKINIFDPQGRLIMKDAVRNRNGFMRPYNLQKMNRGVYKFEITDSFGKHSISVMNTFESFAVKPLDENKYQVLVSKEINGNISIGIYDDQNTLLHKQNIKAESGFSIVYDLSKFASKSYTFKISSKTNAKSFTI